MSLWKRTMDYLGLGPDEAYYDDEFDEEYEPRQRRGDIASRPGPSADVDIEQSDNTGSGRPVFPSRDFDASPSRRQSSSDDSGVMVRSQKASRAGSGEPQAIRPARFDQAQEVADTLKRGQPVIMNLDACERDVARRLIDFASGLCYALDGSMEKVANGVYLLRPTGGSHVDG